MGHKCFISFKHTAIKYKEAIQELNIDMIDKSLNDPINSENEDYIMQKIREDHLSDSTVTICLICDRYAENLHPYQADQTYVKRELQASLYNGKGNTRNGVLGIVLPAMTDRVYKGSYTCSTCGKKHLYVAIEDATTIKEFSYNYYPPLDDGKCAYADEDHYCVLVKWQDFINNPDKYIDQAFDKRTAPIAYKVRVRP